MTDATPRPDMRTSPTERLRLDRHGAVPLYRQVAQRLQHSIDDGHFSRGDRLPSEADLAEAFQVNRLTVRQAIAELVSAQTVETRRGDGNFVRDPGAVFEVIAEPTATGLKFGALGRSLTETGRTYRELFIASGVDDNPIMRSRLEVPRARLRWITTVGSVDDEPWVVNTVWMVDRKLPRAHEGWTEIENLSRYLEGRYQIKLHRSWRSFAAEAAQPRDAELLDVRVGSPLLVREGVDVDDQGQPITAVHRRYTPDRIRFVLRHR